MHVRWTTYGAEVSRRPPDEDPAGVSATLVVLDAEVRWYWCASCGEKRREHVTAALDDLIEREER